MKKNLLSVTLALLFSAVFSVGAGATNSGDDETVSADVFLFRFNRDKTAFSLWFCHRAQATMTLPDKVYYDSQTKTADLKPFGKAKAYPVERIGERTFRGNSEIQSITLPASYRNVEGTAFMNCPNLKTFVSLGKDVIYDKSVFAGCSALENVTINAQTIGAHIFNGCERLVSPHITGTLDHIPDAAFEKSGIRNINFLPQSITAIWPGASMSQS
ncbi:leucine-rich repeat domain-containing protein [Prevotella falsenii]|uniref:leucine-rich repeat domain-containing protein n=1 Tax=Prevotella falsenii TaxID=515414 RepID=UPI001E4E5A79|nr:leucine-rich repeat domain-containing protein [Prevotella falsenii]